MIGLYYLPLPTLMHETGLSLEGASKGLRRASEALFAYYDTTSEHVYVPEMAAYQVGEPLSPNDNRVKGILKEWLTMRKSPFFKDFYQRYKDSFHLPDPKALRSPSEGPSKPLRSQEQEQEKEQEQESKERESKPKRKPGFIRPTLDEVTAYCQSRGKGIDPQAWLDHYTANGWRVGKALMRDWQAAVRTWERNQSATGNGQPFRDYEAERIEARRARSLAAMPKLGTFGGAEPTGEAT
jgi:hypothetical protein